MNQVNPPPRRVLIPPALPSTALHGRGSGLAVTRLDGTTMGTFWSLSCLIPPDISPQQAGLSLESAFARVIAQMSHWDPASDLSRFNRSPAGTWQVLPPEFFRVLAHALTVAEASQGCCDPTLGEIVDLYGFGPSPDTKLDPPPALLHQAIRHCGWQRLQLDSDRQAAFQPGGLRLDLSAIAKGFAVDHAAEALEQLGIGSYLLEIGGEVRGAGCKPDGGPWWCLLAPPPGPESGSLPETVAALCGLSLATSGDTCRQKQWNGRTISHLIDPLTFQPTGRTLASVSVFASSCMDADAWATALFTAGREKGPAMAETQQLPALFTWRTPAGFHQTWSPALAAMLE